MRFFALLRMTAIIITMRFLSDLKKKDISGKTCVLRVDFNVESIKDALRLEASLPSIKFLLKNGAKVLILSHRGRPKGVDPELSLKVFLPFLKKHLKKEIHFLDGLPAHLPMGEVFLMENLRFWPEEEADDADFAKHIAKLGDLYVNDAFAVCHRANASVTQLPKFLPAYVGLLLQKELATLSEVMKKPKKPLLLIFGGAKVEDKLPVIKFLLPKASKVLLGSSVINKDDELPKTDKILKPKDWIAEEGAAFDIGPITVAHYAEEIKKAKTIIWNGPVGKFEDPKYRRGSMEIAKAVAKSKAFTVIGGGETTQLILSLGLRTKIGFLSTGGGAMLEFLAGKKLPGIQALK